MPSSARQGWWTTPVPLLLWQVLIALVHSRKNGTATRTSGRQAQVPPSLAAEPPSDERPIS